MAKKITCNPGKDILVSVENKTMMVDLVRAYEGYHGPYDPNDPDDEEFLRFNLYVKDKDGEWTEAENGSACTDIPASTSLEDCNTLANLIFDTYEKEYGSNIASASILDTTEKLSHLSVPEEERKEERGRAQRRKDAYHKAKKNVRFAIIEDEPLGKYRKDSHRRPGEQKLPSFGNKNHRRSDKRRFERIQSELKDYKKEPLFDIRRVRCIQAVYPHASFEGEVFIKGENKYFNIDVKSEEMVYFHNEEDLVDCGWSYHVPLDEVDFSEDDDTFIFDKELEVFQSLAKLWNENPVWDASEHWMSPKEWLKH